MSWRRIPADIPDQTRMIHSLNDEGSRIFRGIAWGVLLSIPIWAGVLWASSRYWDRLLEWVR